jgi:multicomponent Na+:H+ antiporter subunit B
VVIASGVILLALGRDPRVAMQAFPVGGLSLAETASYSLLLVLGLLGVFAGGRFLENVFPGLPVPRVGFIFALNIVIGVKVGAGVSLICLYLFREETR